MMSKHTHKKLILTACITVVAVITITAWLSTGVNPLDLIQSKVEATTLSSAGGDKKTQISTQQKSINAKSDMLVDLWKLDKRNQFNSVSVNEDKTGDTHSRYKQTYEGIPVWSGDVIIHANQNGNIKKVTGKPVDKLEVQLASINLKKATVSSVEALNLAKQKANDFFSAKNNNQLKFRNEKIEMIIYVDSSGAHQAYHADYVVDALKGMPARPNIIIDAQTGDVLKQWNGLPTAAVGTGPGGNLKIGLHEFGTTQYYGYLDVTADGSNNCTFVDQFNYVKSVNLNGAGADTFAAINNPYIYTCPRNSYRNINGGYSPINDGHFYARKTADMYQSWVGVLPTDDGNALTTDVLLIKTGFYNSEVATGEVAFWEGAAVFGDGGNALYPLSSAADIVAHEISHGFTQLNSNLLYVDQSGGINESYSDIAGEAFEYYWRGTNDWLAAADAIKASNQAIRYFANPTLDGFSIAHANQYVNGMDVHYSSGVFNKAFYLIARLPGWNTQKAFQMFAGANRNYWTETSDFVDASCGVLNATLDQGYDPDPVRFAFESVGVVCNDSSIVLDTDGDGFANGVDTDDDNDGSLDTAELKNGTDPLDVDSDDDGYADGVDLYPSNSQRIGIRGTVSAANLGNAVATADVNGDGYDDVVVGSFKDDPVNQTTGVVMKDAGTVKVYSGADGVLLYRWLGEVAGDNFGISVANAGDVNNDGDDDIIIGATGYDPLVLGSKPLSKAGAAYVYSGAGGASPSIPWIEKFEGKVAGDNFGISVAGGNINGDAYSDLIIGANLADPIDSLTSKVMSSAGRVYIYSGSSLGEIAVLNGDTAGDTFGSAVAVGDVNNDARDDIIVGSPKDELNAAIKDSGSVYVYSGAALPTKTLLTAPKGGVAASDAYGSSVAVGRIDAVAGEDIVVGVPKYDVLGITALKDAGAIYVYSGGSYNPIVALSKTGAKTGDALGAAVATGDVNKDGRSDVVVGVCKSDYTNPVTLKVLKDAGSVNVYSGSTGASLITGSALTGTLATQWFGCAVAAGDTNKDGQADVIVGSPNDDPSLIKDAGSVEIYSGAGL